MYCGINKIPKGKQRGTPEACAAANQIRYYGLYKIDKSVLKNTGKVRNKQKLVAEQLKLKNLEYEALNLIKTYKKLKLEMDLRKEDGKQESKTHLKKLKNIIRKKNKLQKQIKKQKEIVKNIES